MELPTKPAPLRIKFEQDWRGNKKGDVTILRTSEEMEFVQTLDAEGVVSFPDGKPAVATAPNVEVDQHIQPPVAGLVEGQPPAGVVAKGSQVGDPVTLKVPTPKRRKPKAPTD